MIPGLGKSLKRLPRGMTGTGSALTALGVGAASLYGFNSGISSKHVTDNMFELTTGDAQMDQYALGTDVGMRSMLFPSIPMPGFMPGGDIPVSPFAPGYGGRVKTATKAGGVLGMLGGAGAGFALGGAKMSIAGGVVGAGLGAALGFKGSSGGLINNTTMTDTMRARRYDNRMPVVDGGLVFGAYNSRMGGY